MMLDQIEVFVNQEAPVCPVCHQAQEQVLWESPGGERRVFRCSPCQLTFVWPRIEQDFSAVPEESYYGNWEQLDYYGGNFIVADVLAAEGSKARYGRSQSSDMPAVLDVGCGAGQILAHFRAHGWAVAGVEPWRAVARIAQKYLRLAVQAVKLEEADIAPASMDVVLSIDVLQFVANPVNFLQNCCKALKPDGMLYITVPNYASIDSVRSGWNWHYFHPFSYLSYFTPDSIKHLIESTGFYRTWITMYGGPDDDGFLKIVARRAATTTLTWADISEEPEEHNLPPLDRRGAALHSLSPAQRDWRNDGYLILPRLMPDELIERYCAVRRKLPAAEGWHSGTPYMHEVTIRDLCLYKPLVDALDSLIGEPMGLHLNLTGWVSTERDWHQDDYLNPPHVNGHYVGVWMALDDIKEDSGPFEFVPGSHHWPIIRQEKVLRQLGLEDGADKNWPWDSERLLTPFFEQEIKLRNARIERFLGNRGDVLIWHSRLVHRGSLPERPHAERRSMIAHYSGVNHRPDMPRFKRHPQGGLYFLLDERRENHNWLSG